MLAIPTMTLLFSPKWYAAASHNMEYSISLPTIIRLLKRKFGLGRLPRMASCFIGTTRVSWKTQMKPINLEREALST